MASNLKYFQTKINANEMPPEFSCFQEANFSLRTAGDFSTSTERGEQVKCQMPNAKCAQRATGADLAPPSSLLTYHSSLLASPFSLLSPPSSLLPPLSSLLAPASSDAVSFAVRHCQPRRRSHSFVARCRTCPPTRVRPPAIPPRDASPIGRRRRRSDRLCDPAANVDGDARGVRVLGRRQ